MKAAWALLSLGLIACSSGGGTKTEDNPVPPLTSTSTSISKAASSSKVPTSPPPMKLMAVRTTLLGHYTYKLYMDGWTKAQVRTQYGAPKEINTTKFRATAYHVVKALPSADTQWYYPSGLSHRIIWFKEGKVVLALQENSTF